MRRKKTIRWVLSVAALLVIFRLSLPVFAKHYVNSNLEEIGDYAGHVDDIDIALLRGAYTLKGLRLEKIGGNPDSPFVDVESMDISVQWRALFHGELVGEIHARQAAINLIQGPSDEASQLGTGVNWPEEVRRLFPFRFNHFEVTDSSIEFLAPGIDSQDSLFLSDTVLVISNLTNVQEEQVDAFSGLEFTGRFMGTAPLTIEGQIDPNKELPTFDIDFSLEAAELIDVNPWLDEFLNVDAERGVFSMYAEFAAAEGRFEGYAKPILEHAEIYQAGEEASGPFRRAWEALVDLAGNVLANDDQVATRIPLSGELEDPEAGTLAAIVGVLRNAFVGAFTHSLDGSISLRSVDPDAVPDPDTQPDSGSN